MALKAADARTLLQAELPFVLEDMTDAQVQQMQKVLDAAVLDPEIEQEAQEYYSRSTLAMVGSQTIQDPAMVRRGDQVMASYIPVSKADQRIRLDLDVLLEPGALKPVTDNPDEAAYLEKVKHTLTAKGVWLRFASQLVRDPEDPSHFVLDPRTFAVWLSLGPDGDTIPTKSGRLTREAILGTTLLGAGYYERVYLGPVQAALEKEERRLQIDIDSGLQQHQMLAQIRRDAFFGVTEVSDVLGGADFPDQSIWEQPRRFVLRAMDMNVNGNVKGSQVFLVTAAILTRNAANLLADYINDTSSGAERAVTVLKVAKTAGEVAQVGLAVMGVVGPIGGGAAASGGAAVTEESVDAAAERVANKYIAEEGLDADEISGARSKLQPKGSTGGTRKGGHSSGAGTGFH